VKQITITVTPDGQTTVTAAGFEGNQCREATARLREVLGQTQSEQLTPEYFQTRTAAAQQEHGL
jgi:hypothetical protein